MSVDTCVIDVEDWLGADRCCIGDVGGGLLGSEIASTGLDGPGYLFQSLSLPADANKEYIGKVVQEPSFGVLDRGEDTGFTYTRTGDGVDSFQWQLYENLIAIGSPVTVPLQVGVGIDLVGSDCVQEGTITSGVITITPPAPGIINLAGSSCVQGNVSGSGAISTIPYEPNIINLAGSTCLQTNNCTNGTITVSDPTISDFMRIVVPALNRTFVV